MWRRSPWWSVALVMTACSSEGAAVPAGDAGADALGADALGADVNVVDVLDAPAPSGSLSTTCTGTDACSGRLTLASSSLTLPYLSTVSLEGAGSAYTHLVVFIEGFSRQADSDFSTMVAAAKTASALGDTIVVVPEFQAQTSTKGAACTGHVDTPAKTDLLWHCDDWSDGMFAINAPTVSSYGALDALVSATLAANPSLARITIAGFSAGGQFTQRYAAVNRLEGNVSYVVGDPSSFMYLDGRRPVNADACTPSGCPDGFATPAAGSCKSYDDWKYGTQHLVGAAAAFDGASLVSRYQTRAITYLLGTADNAATTAADVADLDTSCAAELQGSYRYQRGLGFYFAATTLFSAGPSKLVTVDGCAHSAACVFKSAAGVAAVF